MLITTLRIKTITAILTVAIHYTYRGILGTESEFSAPASHGLLPDPGVCAMYSDSGAILGVILDQQRSHGRQSGARSVQIE